MIDKLWKRIKCLFRKKKNYVFFINNTPIIKSPAANNIGLLATTKCGTIVSEWVRQVILKGNCYSHPAAGNWTSGTYHQVYIRSKSFAVKCTFCLQNFEVSSAATFAPITLFSGKALKTFAVLFVIVNWFSRFMWFCKNHLDTLTISTKGAPKHRISIYIVSSSSPPIMKRTDFISRW